jgi:hypothetical protein
MNHMNAARLFVCGYWSGSTGNATRAIARLRPGVLWGRVAEDGVLAGRLRTPLFSAELLRVTEGRGPAA